MHNTLSPTIMVNATTLTKTGSEDVSDIIFLFGLYVLNDRPKCSYM